MPLDAPDRDLETFVRGYNAILQKYSVNHEEIDYQKYQIERPNEFPWVLTHQRCWIALKLFFINHFATLVLGAITIFVVILLSFYAYPNQLVPETDSFKSPSQFQTKQSAK